MLYNSHFILNTLELRICQILLLIAKYKKMNSIISEGA